MYKQPQPQNEGSYSSLDIFNDGTKETVQSHLIDKTEAAYINASPNPFKDYIEFTTVLNEANMANVSVTDMLGREILAARTYSFNQGNNFLKIDTRGLRSGIYILNVTIGNQQTHTRMVKQE